MFLATLQLTLPKHVRVVITVLKVPLHQFLAIMVLTARTRVLLLLKESAMLVKLV